MTPYAKAQEILGTIQGHALAIGFPLPQKQYVTFGDPVVDCASVIITLTGINAPSDYPAGCNTPQMGTFIVLLVRECANISAPSGETIPAVAEQVADIQSADAQFLWDVFNEAFAGYLDTSWNIGFALSGSTAVTSCSLTTGID